MMIKGKEIADKIYKQLLLSIAKLKQKSTTPTLSIILIGKDPASRIYVTNKVKKADKLGIKVILVKKDENTKEEEIIREIKKFNNNPNTHGLILQLPIPNKFDPQKLINYIDRKKDVDGFLENSPFIAPISKAVIYSLENIMIRRRSGVDLLHPPGELASHLLDLKSWLRDKNIVVIGKGITGGKPIYKELVKLCKNTVQIDSKTKNPDELIRVGDIVISCVGKKRIVNKDNCKKGAILVSVGMHMENGKLKGDYDEEEIKDCATYYTPTPGGVGPLTVAALLENTVEACRNLQNTHY